MSGKSAPQIAAVSLRERAEDGAKKRTKPWQPYIDATLGFRNHWYPVFFGSELKEGDISHGLGEGAVSEVKTLQILGERILFRRVNGKVCGIKDQCLHRGSPFSVKPECYTKETITCWYHGFTYDLRDGSLKTILTDPKSPLIGKVAIKSYPVEERQGMVFVFIGDMDPPPLEDDVQPGFLDDSLTIYPDGRTVVAKGNWRMAAENGFDPAHTYIHRNSPLVRAFRLPTVFGDTGLSESHGLKVVDGPGPKGVMLIRGVGNPVWEAEIEPGVKLKARFMSNDEGVNNEMVPEVSIWMPGGLKVDPFPAPGVIMFEWYVPVDEDHYRYIMTWSRYLTSPHEKDRFLEEVATLWKPLVPTTFTNEDEQAREAIHEFYASEDGWYKERLFGPDVVITRWRELASRVNRGIQRRGLD